MPTYTFQNAHLNTYLHLNTSLHTLLHFTMHTYTLHYAHIYTSLCTLIYPTLHYAHSLVNTSLQRDCLITLWKALVHCSQLGPPHKTRDIQILESVQRSLSKQIREMKEPSYWDRLKILGRPTKTARYIIIYTQRLPQWSHSSLKEQGVSANGCMVPQCKLQPGSELSCRTA